MPMMNPTDDQDQSNAPDQSPDVPAPSLTDVLSGQPAQPASPDLGPSPSSPTPAFKPGIAQRIIGSVLGLVQNGVPGAIAGGIDPRISAQARTNAQQNIANEQSESASKARFASTDAAKAAVSLAMEQHNLSRLPLQERLQAEAGDRSTEDNFDKLGLQPIAAGPAGQADSILKGAYDKYSQSGEDGVPNLRLIHSAGGMVKVFDVSDMGSSDEAYDVLNQSRDERNLPPVTKADFFKMGQTPAGVAKRQALVDTAVTYFSPKATGKDSDNQATLAGLKGNLAAYIARTGAGPSNPTVQKYNKTIADFTAQSNAQAALKAKDLQTASDNRLAEKRAAAAQKAAATPDWKVGVTADEKKKAELAENIAENANQIAQIVIRRPDLLGPASGRITTVEQMLGNNDPDISKLAIAVHNTAMANSGVHGFRSNEGVKDTEQMILNNFKNGRQSVGGALKGLTTSTQTFIDNARPEGYKTHSKSGGAVKAMGK